MYAKYFGLKQEPFSIAPDPRYLYMSERHREALAHLLFGVKGAGGGFVLLTGEIGAGKTTVCRCLLEQVPKRCNVAYIFNPKLTALELMKTVCDEFRIPVHHQGPALPTIKDYLDPLNRFLLDTHAVGQNNVLIIDEAQNLSPGTIEQLRLLTNLETNERKLLQIVLIGQPELRTMLRRPELEQVAQRVIARYHLEALTEEETRKYLLHRLAVAGLATSPPFSKAAVHCIHARSRGVPRRINLLADRALLGAYAEGSTRVTEDIVQKAAAEVFGRDERWSAWSSPRVLWWGAGAGVGALLIGAAALWLWPRAPGSTVTVTAPPAFTASAPVAAASAPASAAMATNDAATTLPPAAIKLTAQEVGERVGARAPSDAQAWRELAPLWGLVLPADAQDPCAAVPRAQWQCFRKPDAGLALIRQLDRPGVITLRDAAGRAVPALLTGLSESSATVVIGGAPVRVSLASLAQVWGGDFATYWRTPEGYTGVLADGATGPTVDWLAVALARWRGEPAPDGRAGAQRYDAVLRGRVQAFQLAQGLAVDGRAGPTTLMQLARASGPSQEPRLSMP